MWLCPWWFIYSDAFLKSICKNINLRKLTMKSASWRTPFWRPEKQVGSHIGHIRYMMQVGIPVPREKRTGWWAQTESRPGVRCRDGSGAGFGGRWTGFLWVWVCVYPGQRRGRGDPAQQGRMKSSSLCLKSHDNDKEGSKKVLKGWLEDRFCGCYLWVR